MKVDYLYINKFLHFIFINSLLIMIEALQKTLILLLLIGLGLALRSKIKNKTEISGIKEIILSIALFGEIMEMNIL